MTTEFQRIFVLGSDLDALVMMARALRHISNLSVGFRSRATGHLHDDRFDYPNNHIEIDDRLVWFTGPLQNRFETNQTLYLRLQSDRLDAIRSHLRRWNEDNGAVSALAHGMVMKGNDWMPDQRFDVCAMYVDAVEANLEEHFSRLESSLTVESTRGPSNLITALEQIGLEADFDRMATEWRQGQRLRDVVSRIAKTGLVDAHYASLTDMATAVKAELEDNSSKVDEIANLVRETEDAITKERERREGWLTSLTEALDDEADPDWDDRWNPHGPGLADVSEAARRAAIRLSEPERASLTAQDEVGVLGVEVERLGAEVGELRLRAEVAEARLGRLSGRRGVRLLSVFGRWIRRPWRVDRLAAGVVDSLRKVRLPEIPSSVDPVETGKRLPPPSPLPYPSLRVAHGGRLGMFERVTAYQDVDAVDWEAELEVGYDMLLLEPGLEDDDLSDAPTGLIERFRTAGVPVVMVARIMDHLRLEAVKSCDLVVTEDPDIAAKAERRHQCQVLVLDPSIEEQAHNPIGWIRNPEAGLMVISDRPNIGSDIDKLAAADNLTTYGTTITRLTPTNHHADRPVGNSQAAAAKNHIAAYTSPHLTTTPTAHIQQALEYTASGTPVLAPPSHQLDHLLPGHYHPVTNPHDLTTAFDELADATTREHHSIPARRHVLTHHTRRHRFEQILTHLKIPTNPQPRISILLSTIRPENLDHALTQVTRQTWNNKELLLLLHGTDGIDLDTLTRRLQQLPYPATLLPCPSTWTFGDCLNHGLDHATGTYITKMDDDDHYGPHHLTDLHTAHTYSNAHITGKWRQHAYLADFDLTVTRPRIPVERYRANVAGGTIFMPTRVARTYRFLRRNSRVDSTLYERLTKKAGLVYATHPLGFLLTRRDEGHTWDMDYGPFVNGASAVEDGVSSSALEEVK